MDRKIPKGYQPFISVNQFNEQTYKPLEKVLSKGVCELIESVSSLFDKLDIKDGMTLSFHHHYRNGDLLLNMVLAEIKKKKS